MVRDNRGGYRPIFAGPGECAWLTGHRMGGFTSSSCHLRRDFHHEAMEAMQDI